jgi:hypothetical protein
LAAVAPGTQGIEACETSSQKYSGTVAAKRLMFSNSAHERSSGDYDKPDYHALGRMPRRIQCGGSDFA